MSHYSGGFRTSGAGTTALPMASLYSGGATNIPRIREIGVFNSTSTAFAVGIRKATSLGGTHTGRDELLIAPTQGPAASALLFDTDTGTAPTISAGNVRVAEIGGAPGSGVSFVFGDEGLLIPEGTGNGIVIIGIAGTPQICSIYFDWDE